jgi:acyl-CoA synthetase (AMP-forming)/AMP-acid ligase II
VAVALVVAAPGATIDEAALHHWCKARLAGYKVPRHFVLIDAFPPRRAPTAPRSRAAKLRAMASALAAAAD